MRKFAKDPAAELDYTWDWSDFLTAGETITAHEVFTDIASLAIESSSADDTSVTAWLVDGDAGARGLVTCRVTTSQDRTDERSIYIQVSDQ